MSIYVPERQHEAAARVQPSSVVQQTPVTAAALVMPDDVNEANTMHACLP